MNKSIFDPKQQEQDTSSKIVAGLERISEVFKILLWEKAKLNGLSPIQIQLLIFIQYHKAALCNVSHLAKEFNITKPTVSDAIKVLDMKELIVKDYSSTDSRSYFIQLSLLGEQVVSETNNFAEPLKSQIDNLDETELNGLFSSLAKLIYKLNCNGILTVQRSCYGCVYYSKKESFDYCNLLEKELQQTDIRLDCPEYVEKDGKF